MSTLDRPAAQSRLGRARPADFADLTGRLVEFQNAQWDDVAAMRLMRLDAAAVSLAEGLGHQAARCRVLKGLAVGRLDYPPGTLRPSSDVDLLVPDDLVRRVLELLRDATVVGGGSRAHEKAITLRASTSIDFDIHVRINRFLPFDASLWFDRPESIPGLGLLSLPADLRLIHAAIHYVTSIGDYRNAMSMLDVVQVLQRPDCPSAEDLRRTAASVGAEGIVKLALEMEAEISGRDGSYLGDWDEPTRIQQRVFLSDERRPVAERLLMFRALETSAARWSLAKDLGSRPFVRQRGARAS